MSLPDAAMMRAASGSGRDRFSCAEMFIITSMIAVSCGDGTRIHKHLLRTGSKTYTLTQQLMAAAGVCQGGATYRYHWVLTLETVLHIMTRRQTLEYFSIVRRNECWASFVRLSTSCRTRILIFFLFSIDLFLAMSLMISCITYLQGHQVKNASEHFQHNSADVRTTPVVVSNVTWIHFHVVVTAESHELYLQLPAWELYLPGLGLHLHFGYICPIKVPEHSFHQRLLTSSRRPIK